MSRRSVVIAMLVAGCQGQDSETRWRHDPRAWELSALQADRRVASQQLQAHRVLDSLGAVVSRFPRGFATMIVGLDSAAPAARLAVETAVSELWPAEPAQSLRLAVIFSPPGVRDSIRRPSPFEGTILPELTDKETCVAVGSTRTNWQGAWVGATRGQLQRLIAPCLYWDRFGPPGTGIADWLAATKYQAVQSAEWLFRPGTTVQGYDRWFDTGRGEWFAPFILALGRDRVPPYGNGVPAVGCLAGRTAACEELIRGPARNRRGAVPPAVTSVVTADYDQYFSELGGRAEWVDHLIRTRGEPAFRRFWRSDADLAEAYRAAFGEDLGPAVATWERHDWEKRRGQPPVRLGASINPLAAFAGLGWWLLILLLPLVAARRRTMF